MSTDQTTDHAAWLRENAPLGPMGRRMADAATEIERLQADRLLLAAAALHITPDSLVQTDAEVEETQELIRATAARVIREAAQ